MASNGKIKTHKASSKRFRVTGTGKLTHRHTSRAHSMISKTPGRRRRLYQESGLYPGKNWVVSRQLANGAKS
jgi:large subunit ribosomal protein L35